MAATAHTHAMPGGDDMGGTVQPGALGVPGALGAPGAPPDFSAALRAPVSAPPPRVGPSRRRGPLEEVTWPILGADALYGVAGDVVRAITPHSEADQGNLLAHFLVMIGNAAGGNAHALAAGRRHPMKIFGVVVGDSASGKGEAEGRVRDLIGRVDPGWELMCVKSGLSSGEGMINVVRDPEDLIEGQMPPERRALFVESEFGGTLGMMGRDRNSLSNYMRQAWDGPRIATLTKQPTQATNAYVSVIGHVTPYELRRALAAVDLSNGYANRHLWFKVRRANDRPDGGGQPHYGRATRHLMDALTFARTINRPIVRDADATRLWETVYGDLTRPGPEPVASVLARVRPQVLRLSVIYAVLDFSHLVTEDHLRAALAVWAYCKESATEIFGGGDASSLGLRILTALRQAGDGGLSRTGISAVLGNHAKAREIQAELESLEEDGLAWHERVQVGKAVTTVYCARAP